MKNRANFKSDLVGWDGSATGSVGRGNVHFVATLANVLALAEVVDVGHPLPGLTFALHDDVFDLGVGGGDEELGAEEADAPEDLDGLGEESGMEDRLGQVEVAKVSGALVHVAGTRQAASGAVDHALPGVHQTAQLGTSSLQAKQMVRIVSETCKLAFFLASSVNPVLNVSFEPK